MWIAYMKGPRTRPYDHAHVVREFPLDVSGCHTDGELAERIAELRMRAWREEVTDVWVDAFVDVCAAGDRLDVCSKDALREVVYGDMDGMPSGMPDLCNIMREVKHVPGRDKSDGSCDFMCSTMRNDEDYRHAATHVSHDMSLRLCTGCMNNWPDCDYFGSWEYEANAVWGNLDKRRFLYRASLAFDILEIYTGEDYCECDKHCNATE